MKIQPSKTGTKSDPEGNHPCLDKLLKVDKQSSHHELYKQRRIPRDRHSRLRNKEFLITLVLQGEGHLTAIPPAWQVPHHELPQAGSKRSSAEAQSGMEVEDGSDLSDRNILPKKIQQRMWLHWHPAMHISLWCKHTDPATTDEQRAEHKKLHFALLSSKNGPDTTVKQTCNMYQERCGDKGVKPLAKVEMFRDFMIHVANHLKTLSSGGDKYAPFWKVVRAGIAPRTHRIASPCLSWGPS
ncbi:hypothetical protein WJX77_003707 [Trebouxia sp. C0004]